jgi:hypothetical protein
MSNAILVVFQVPYENYTYALRSRSPHQSTYNRLGSPLADLPGLTP